jgi:glycosyltransferase involved in cell wall biosynthesis
MLRLDPETRFLVVGQGAEWDEVETTASELGVLNRNFFMWNSVPKQDVPNILSAADVATSLFVNLKPMWNNSANRFFDALASGTPIAINYGGWQQALLKQHSFGVDLDPTDIASSARRLHDLLQDRERLASTGRNARYVAETLFDRDEHARLLESVLLNAT